MAKEHVHGVFESIAEGYDAANDRISLGMHGAWKKALCKTAVKACDIVGLGVEKCNFHNSNLLDSVSILLYRKRSRFSIAIIDQFITND